MTTYTITDEVTDADARLLARKGAMSEAMAIVRALAAKEPRTGRTANTHDLCALCGVMEDVEAWEAWHDKHGWGYLDRDIEHRECPDMPIDHRPDCAYALACKLVGET